MNIAYGMRRAVMLLPLAAALLAAGCGLVGTTAATATDAAAEAQQAQQAKQIEDHVRQRLDQAQQAAARQRQQAEDQAN